MMDDYCHVFVLTSLSIDENGDVKRRNVAVTFDLFEAEDHRNRGVEHEYDVFVFITSYMVFSVVLNYNIENKQHNRSH